MKIAMIVNSFPSLSEKFLINQIVGLIQEGVDIDIYAAVKSGDRQVHALYQEYDLEKKTTQLDIPKSAIKRFLRLPALVLRNFFRAPGLLIRAFSSAKYQRASRNLKTLYFLDAFCGKKYDVIHCQFGQNGLIGAFLKDCGFTKRLVVTFHGSDITVFPKKEGTHVYDYMFTRADAVTAGTRFTANLIQAHGCPSEKLHIIPAGIISKKYPQADTSERNCNVILSVGRLQEVKGFQYSIAAFSLIAAEYTDLKYIIAGNGSMRSELEQLIMSKGLKNRAFLVGEKTDTEIMALYRQASIFLAPSIRASNGSEEGQGLVIQEAEISGIPVIAANTGGIPEGLIDGKTGFLVPEKNAESIAEKIRILVTNSAKARSMGAEGRKFALENYDVTVLTRKFLALYIEF